MAARPRHPGAGRSRRGRFEAGEAEASLSRASTRMARQQKGHLGLRLWRKLLNFCQICDTRQSDVLVIDSSAEIMTDRRRLVENIDWLLIDYDNLEDGGGE